ncbi:aldehyde dehydrogenase family protein [Arthrobacter sp. OAP107]|uniref:aldehyde dehydrogenase family protein n=1 Tax=Arthrobacter sp. OAP107 TaxID=3156445 RepID=UPI00339981B3
MITPEPELSALYDAVLDRARSAAKAFSVFDRPKVDRIVRAVAEVAHQNSRQLAQKAADETGFGVFEDKVAKNEGLSAGFMREYGNLDLVSHRTDSEKKLVLDPIPAGVIFAVTPSTSPVANLYFKVLSSLLTRNAIVISPHPAAVKTSIEAARILSRAATDAGAPEGAIQILEEPSVPLVEAVMGDARVNLILATGGGAVVQAAYRSGTPAIGVGPGNAPVVVDDTANLEQAADEICASKAFDNSVLCTAESVLIMVEPIASRMKELLVRRGAYLCRPDETRRLRAYMYPSGKFNTEVVGRPAREIAKKAGISVPENTQLLLATIDSIRDDEPFTHEKLSPVLAVITVEDFEQALTAAASLVDIVGVGHSAVIHSEDPQHVLDYSHRIPVHRVAVNIGGSLGNAGIGTGLPLTMSIGTGFVGGSSLDENLSPERFVQWKRTAYPVGAKFPEFSSLQPTPATGSSVPGIALGDDAVREELRRLIVEELRGLVGQSRG